jgi:hypothetical protein
MAECDANAKLQRRFDQINNQLRGGSGGSGKGQVYTYECIYIHIYVYTCIHVYTCVHIIYRYILLSNIAQYM